MRVHEFQDDPALLEVGQNKTFFIYVVIKGNKGEVSNTAIVASKGLTPTPDPVAGNDSSTRVVVVGK